MKSDGKVNQPSTKKAGIQRRKPTINDQHISTKSDDRRSIYLFIVGSNNINIQDCRQYQTINTTIGDYRQFKYYIPQKQGPQLIAK